MANDILCTSCGVSKAWDDFRPYCIWSNGTGECDGCRRARNAAIRQRTKQKKCILDGCENGQQYGGLCSLHASRKKAHGDVGPVGRIRQKRGPICIVADCGRAAQAGLGLCGRHYARQRKWGSPTGGYQRVTGPGTKCSIDGCSRERWWLSLCTVHGQRKKKYGDPVGVSPKRKAAAERRLSGKLNPDGYKLVWAPSHSECCRPNWALEHRKVMSDYLDRPLRDNENVHHVNGVKDDNRLSNLELWVSSHPSGQRVNDLLKWAREIESLYGDEVAAHPKLERNAKAKAKAKTQDASRAIDCSSGWFAEAKARSSKEASAGE